jgi:hypothetical protein
MSCPQTLDFSWFLPSWTLKKTGIIRVRKIYTNNLAGGGSRNAV